LCRIYRIWQISPLDLRIPLTCNEQHDLAVYNLPAQAHPDLLLPQQESFANGTSVLVHAFGNVVIVETIIEYVSVAYGREQLPLLLETSGQHASPETLIPAVFGVTLAEFEAGWQRYMAENYGVTPAGEES
jgi:hypothetical protein